MARGHKNTCACINWVDTPPVGYYSIEWRAHMGVVPFILNNTDDIDKATATAYYLCIN